MGEPHHVSPRPLVRLDERTDQPFVEHLHRLRTSARPTAARYGSGVLVAEVGNAATSLPYKSAGKSQRSRRRLSTSVNGDNSTCVRPLTSTTLTLIVFMA